jgi:hypothetical protein
MITWKSRFIFLTPKDAITTLNKRLLCEKSGAQGGEHEDDSYLEYRAV